MPLRMPGTGRSFEMLVRIQDDSDLDRSEDGAIRE
jgi:hypothetical protein